MTANEFLKLKLTKVEMFCGYVHWHLDTIEELLDEYAFIKIKEIKPNEPNNL